MNVFKYEERKSAADVIRKCLWEHRVAASNKISSPHITDGQLRRDWFYNYALQREFLCCLAAISSSTSSQFRLVFHPYSHYITHRSCVESTNYSTCLMTVFQGARTESVAASTDWTGILNVIVIKISEAILYSYVLTFLYDGSFQVPTYLCKRCTHLLTK